MLASIDEKGEQVYRKHPTERNTAPMYPAIAEIMAGLHGKAFIL